MPSFTLEQIIKRAASASDQHDGFVEPEEWLAWANVELRGLDIFLARLRWIHPGPTATEVSAAPYNIALPTETLCVLGVWEVDQSGRYRLLEYSNTVSSRLQDPTTGQTTGAAREYWIEDNAGVPTVRFYPRPTSGRYVALSFSGQTLFTDLTDSVSYPLGFEERMVLRLALRALNKEESSTSSVDRLLRDEEQRIEESCWASQLAEVPRIRKHRRTEWDHEPLYPEVGRWTWL